MWWKMAYSVNHLHSLTGFIYMYAHLMSTLVFIFAALAEGRVAISVF